MAIRIGIRRRVQGIKRIPSVCDAVMGCVVGHHAAEAFNGGLQWHQLAVDGHRNSVALVVGLRGVRGPSTIAWSVVAVIVDAVEFVSSRAWSHLSKEARKVRAPLVGHRDATSAVIRKIARLWVVAARLRGFPFAVFHCARLAVRTRTDRRSLTLPAPTTPRRSVPQCLTNHESGCAA